MSKDNVSKDEEVENLRGILETAVSFLEEDQDDMRRKLAEIEDDLRIAREKLARFNEEHP